MVISVLESSRICRVSPPSLERETGFEPATNSLEGYDSTTELLPRSKINFYYLHLRGLLQESSGDLEGAGFEPA